MHAWCLFGLAAPIGVLFLRHPSCSSLSNLFGQLNFLALPATRQRAALRTFRQPTEIGGALSILPLNFHYCVVADLNMYGCIGLHTTGTAPFVTWAGDAGLPFFFFFSFFFFFFFSVVSLAWLLRYELPAVLFVGFKTRWCWRFTPQGGQSCDRHKLVAGGGLFSCGHKIGIADLSRRHSHRSLTVPTPCIGRQCSDEHRF